MRGSYRSLWGLLPLALAACLAGGAVHPARAADKVVYINSSGGTLDDIYRKTFWDPFTAATGIRVVSSAPVDQAKLMAMVKSGNVIWDVTEVDDGDFWRSKQLGLLAKLDLSKLPISDMPKGTYDPYGIWENAYSTVLVWDTDKWPMAGKHPTSLMDLWNQKDFPGPRCLWKDAIDNLELGVMHAGVPRDKVYPIDQDLAYKQLDELAKNVAVWWTTGAQSVQSIVNHDCVMGTTWNGRPYQLVVKDHAHLGVAWDDAILHSAWWAIPKGAPHYDAAMKLLAWMEDPHRAVRQAVLTGYAGPNRLIAQYLPKDTAAFLATAPEHMATTLIASDQWWAENGPAAEKRFLGWVISK